MMELEEDFFPNVREMETGWCYVTEGRKNKTQYLFLHLPVGLPFFFSLSLAFCTSLINLLRRKPCPRVLRLQVGQDSAG